MKNDEIYKLMRGLQDPAVQIPRCQANLRRQLMAMHAGRRKVRPSAHITKASLLHGRDVSAPRHIMRLGLIVGAVLIILLSLLMVLPTANNSSNRKFVTAVLPTVMPENQRPEAPHVPDQKSATKETSARSAEITQTTPQPSVTPASSPSRFPAPANSIPPASAASESRPVSGDSNNATDQTSDPPSTSEYGKPKKDKAPKDKPDKNKVKHQNPNQAE